MMLYSEQWWGYKTNGKVTTEAFYRMNDVVYWIIMGIK